MDRLNRRKPFPQKANPQAEEQLTPAKCSRRRAIARSETDVTGRGAGNSVGAPSTISPNHGGVILQPHGRIRAMDDKLWYLKRSDLFEQLSPDEITGIESRSRMQTLPRKSLVYLPSDSSDAVFLLTKGRIKLYNVTAEGKETVLAFIEPGEIFGELSLLNPGQREEFAEAMAPSNVVMIPGDVIRELMETRPALTIRLTKLMGLRRQRIERRLKSLLFRSNRERLIYLLLELAARYGERIEDGLALGIRLSHQELSSVIGSTRETVTVLLGELQLERSLIIKRRQIILTNLRQLASSLDEVLPEVERLIEGESAES